MKLLGGVVSMDVEFVADFANSRVTKSVELMGALEQLTDPQCKLIPMVLNRKMNRNR